MLLRLKDAATWALFLRFGHCAGLSICDYEIEVKESVRDFHHSDVRLNVYMVHLAAFLVVCVAARLLLASWL